jgi:hypothetical protein
MHQSKSVPQVSHEIVNVTPPSSGDAVLSIDSVMRAAPLLLLPAVIDHPENRGPREPLFSSPREERRRPDL